MPQRTGEPVDFVSLGFRVSDAWTKRMAKPQRHGEIEIGGSTSDDLALSPRRRGAASGVVTRLFTVIDKGDTDRRYRGCCYW